MEQVQTPKDMQQAYQAQYRNYKKAVENGFCFEAVAIGYAIMEDRLAAFLHHAGIISRQHANMQVTAAVYPYMRALLGLSAAESVRVKNIGTKIEVIRAVLALTPEKVTEIEQTVAGWKAEGLLPVRWKPKKGYLSDLLKLADRLDRTQITETLDRLIPWKEGRNQLIHALLRQKADSAESEKARLAEEGYQITRDLDNLLVKPFKRNNPLRRKYGIQ